MYLLSSDLFKNFKESDGIFMLLIICLRKMCPSSLYGMLNVVLSYCLCVILNFLADYYVLPYCIVSLLLIIIIDMCFVYDYNATHH